jgi:tRNA G37 N-methylase Trm5
MDSSRRQRRRNDFENAKTQCLGKRDKSFAGRIDPRAVEVCGIINEREDMYTTSSCSGRCFQYMGPGIKSSTEFTRFRISHEKISDPLRYFDLTTIETDPTGGGDPIRTIGQYDYRTTDTDAGSDDDEADESESLPGSIPADAVKASDQTVWLRFEPFILHVACRSLAAASTLMNAARPTFKNVGLTTWKESRFLVAVWGDEGLELPLCTPVGVPLHQGDESLSWLASMVNERHERNMAKIHRLCQSLRDMGSPSVDDDMEGHEYDLNYGFTIADTNGNPKDEKVPKSYDVIGDVAYLHVMPELGADAQSVGSAIMKKNKSIKVVVARKSNLEGTERAPGEDGLVIIAGAERNPLITTHTEYGVKCVVDLSHTFFSPRMGPERLRICQQVARGEDVLVCFAGVGMEAMQIAGRTEASSVLAIELNDVAIECARRGHRILERNKAVKCIGAAQRLKILHGDVLTVVPSLNRKFDRILAPRPKEGKMDGDIGTGDGGETFLNVLVPHLKEGGECHWYDFVADHEYPACQRTKAFIQKVCTEHGKRVEVLHVAHVGSVAKRQLRVCLDFKVVSSDIGGGNRGQDEATILL